MQPWITSSDLVAIIGYPILECPKDQGGQNLYDNELFFLEHDIHCSSTFACCSEDHVAGCNDDGGYYLYVDQPTPGRL